MKVMQFTSILLFGCLSSLVIAGLIYQEPASGNVNDVSPSHGYIQITKPVVAEANSVQIRVLARNDPGAFVYDDFYLGVGPIDPLSTSNVVQNFGFESGVLTPWATNLDVISSTIPTSSTTVISTSSIPSDTSFVSTAANSPLRNEKELLSSLKHPGIIRFIDDDFRYSQRTRKSMLMEYCSAGSLFDFIQGIKAAKYDVDTITDPRSGLIPDSQVWLFFVQIAHALAFCHSRSLPVVHRDIKPENGSCLDTHYDAYQSLAYWSIRNDCAHR